MAVPYDKPATTISEQIALLRKRRLIIDDQQNAEHFLLHIGYYRLAGYWHIFQKDRINHIFEENVSFETILELYNFDRELRLLLMDAIERIEVSFRSLLSDTMCCSYGPLWYAEKRFAHNIDIYNNIMTLVDDELDRSKEEFIKHHDKTYGRDDYPPAWKTLQILSFGTLSKLYGNLPNSLPEKKVIAKKYGLPAFAWMQSWLLVVSALRNHCAHHSRICHRLFTFPPKDMNRAPLPWLTVIPYAHKQQNQRLYYQLCAIRYLLHSCSPGNHFTSKLKALIDKHPSVEIWHMGFHDRWENELLWR